MKVHALMLVGLLTAAAAAEARDRGPGFGTRWGGTDLTVGADRDSDRGVDVRHGHDGHNEGEHGRNNSSDDRRDDRRDDRQHFDRNDRWLGERFDDRRHRDDRWDRWRDHDDHWRHDDWDRRGRWDRDRGRWNYDRFGRGFFDRPGFYLGLSTGALLFDGFDYGRGYREGRCRDVYVTRYDRYGRPYEVRATECWDAGSRRWCPTREW